MLPIRSRILAAVCAASFFALAGSAEAACAKFGFSVNDYGKEGPAADAQALLDKHIAAWAEEKGIKKYTTGKKSVDCQLFLDVILFDEYTCRATASVCWEGPPAASAAPHDAKK